MRSLKSLSILALFIIGAFVLTSSSCGSTCTAPTITFDPSGTTLSKAPGEKFTMNVVVTGDADNIKSIVISKSSNGVTDPAFLSLTSVGEKGKTVVLTDSIPANTSIGSVITYTVTATSDCKDGAAETKTLTLTVGASTTRLDDLLFLVENAVAPRVYSRYSSNGANNSAWDLQNRLPKLAADANTSKDIRDSASAANPFAGRWGSRNGSKFVKAPSTFDFANASPKLILDAYKAGTASDLITFVAGDFIIVNIKNSNTYSVVKIKSLADDGAASNEDYTFFSYKLAQ